MAIRKKFENKRAHIIWRYAIVSAVISLLAFAIIYKIVDTTIVHAPQWNQKADETLSKVFYILPKRGDILASDGTVLATNLTSYDICMDYRTAAKHDSLFVARLPELSDSMAKYYPKRSSDQWREYLAEPLRTVPSKRKRAHMLLKNATYADFERIKTFPFYADFKKKFTHGLYYTQKERRMMPYGSMANRSIGRCSYRPEARFEGASERKDSTDVLKGYSGLESALDTLLYGKLGRSKYVQLTRGVRAWEDQPAEDGHTVRTTIDIKIQDIVETQLQEMLQKTGAEWGTCLLMEVETGAIKAISNLDRAKDGSYIEAMNYALQAFEPGSVMKPISMIVALEDNFAPLDRVYPIGRTYAYGGGAPIRDTHSPGALPVRQFIEYSSNIGMTKLITPHYSNNLNGFRDRLAELGFFDRFGTGMQGERPPYFPTLDPKAGGHISLSRMSYGYATMIPPLYTCAVYNAIANKGKFVRPRLVDAEILSDGTEIPWPVSYVRDSICSQRNAKILMEMLYSVVYGAGGTAKTLRDGPVTIVGKTGTCIISVPSRTDTLADGRVIRQKGGYRPGHYRLAFCGIFPYENPKYTCMALISDPSPAYRGAASTSGHIVRGIAEKMYAMGMLDRYSDYKSGGLNSSQPTFYAANSEQTNAVKDLVQAPRIMQARQPAKTEANTIPDLKNLSMREALARVEDAGYRIEIHGQGLAYEQVPAAGTPAQPGETVKVVFKHR